MILPYLIKIVLISGLLFGYYFCFLRNKRFHQYNRFYLLLMAVLPIFLPLVKIPLPDFLRFDDSGPTVSLLSVSNGTWQEFGGHSLVHDSFGHFLNLSTVLVLVYIAGAGFLFVSLVRSLRYVQRITRLYPSEKISGIRFFQTDEPQSPFSFFRKIFWNRNLDLQSPAGRQIFRHEWYHVHHRHSLDILLLEILTVLCWFNPFVYLFRKELKAIHEFLADQYAVSDHDPCEYAQRLIEASIRRQRVDLVNPFFQHQIKRRIIMLTQINHPGNNYLSRVMTLPLLFILFCAFAPKIRMADHHPLKSAKTLTVVVDAGHGGIDPGAQSEGIAEKDLALSIARKIRELSGEYHINVIMTREKDELPGGGHDIREALLYRANLVTRTKADLFLSIHVMADPGDKQANGFDMYIPGDGSAVHQKSVEFGSILSARISRDYKTAPDLKQRETPGILVLKNARVPAVLVECGYLTNDKDRVFISQPTNQEKIARDMLESIVQFGDNKTSYNASREDQLSDTLKPTTADQVNIKEIKEMHVVKEKNKVILVMKNGDSLVLDKVHLGKKPLPGDPKAREGAADGQFPERNPAWAAGL